MTFITANSSKKKQKSIDKVGQRVIPSGNKTPGFLEAINIFFDNFTVKHKSDALTINFINNLKT